MFLMFMGFFLYGESSLTEANDIKKDNTSQGCKDKCDQTREKESIAEDEFFPDHLKTEVTDYCYARKISYYDDEEKRQCVKAWKASKREEWKECLSDCDLRYR